MAISIDEKVEFKAVITSVDATSIDVSIKEVFVDGKWEQFTVPKTMNILFADYNTALITDTEKLVMKGLIDKYLPTLTGDDFLAATSLSTKLV